MPRRGTDISVIIANGSLTPLVRGQTIIAMAMVVRAVRITASFKSVMRPEQSYRRRPFTKMTMASSSAYANVVIMTENPSIKANILAMTASNVSAAITCPSMGRACIAMTLRGR